MNWDQLKTILWLRWRLTRNQWQRAGGFGAVMAVIVAVGGVVLGGATFVGGLLGAALGLGEVKPMVLMWIWLGVTAAFLFFWLIGLFSELQRSETIDLQRLMHLPVALGQMFVINYVASHFALSIILMLPAMTGLALGLTFSRGPAMLLLLPLAWSMIFMISAWTYCLRGWLATMIATAPPPRDHHGSTFAHPGLPTAEYLFQFVRRRHSIAQRRHAGRKRECAAQGQGKESTN